MARALGFVREWILERNATGFVAVAAWRQLCHFNPLSVCVTHTLTHVHILVSPHARCSSSDHVPAAPRARMLLKLSHVPLLAYLVCAVRVHAPSMRRMAPFYPSSPTRSRTHSSRRRTLEKERRKVIEDKDNGVEQDEEKHHACLGGARARGVGGRQR